MGHMARDTPPIHPPSYILHFFCKQCLSFFFLMRNVAVLLLRLCLSFYPSAVCCMALTNHYFWYLILFLGVRHHICQKIYTSNLLTNNFFTRKRVNRNTWHFATKQRNSDYKAILFYSRSNYTNTLISFVLFVHSFIHLSHIFTRLSRFNHIFV